MVVDAAYNFCGVHAARTSPCGSPGASRPRVSSGRGRRDVRRLWSRVAETGRADRLCAPDAQTIRLHAAAALIGLRVRELHDMGRVRDLDGVGHHCVEHQPIGPDRSNVAHLILASHLSSRVSSHRHGSAALRPGTNVQQLPGANVKRSTSSRPDDDVGRPGRTASHPTPTPWGTDPFGVVIDERSAVGDHGVVDHVPITTELTGDLVHRAAVRADLFDHPPPGPVGHHQPGRRDRRHVVSPRARRARPVWTRLPPLPPPCRSPAARQVNELHTRTVLYHHRTGAARTRRPRVARLDMHHDQRVMFRRRHPARSHRADLPTTHRHA